MKKIYLTVVALSSLHFFAIVRTSSKKETYTGTLLEQKKTIGKKINTQSREASELQITQKKPDSSEVSPSAPKKTTCKSENKKEIHTLKKAIEQLIKELETLPNMPQTLIQSIKRAKKMIRQNSSYDQLNQMRQELATHANIRRIPKKKTRRTVKVVNSIDETDIAYKHWTGTYQPEKFVLKVNKSELKAGSQQSVSVEDEVMLLEYDCKFVVGTFKRKVRRQAFVKLDTQADTIKIGFSWHGSKDRFAVDNAHIISITDLS